MKTYEQGDTVRTEITVKKRASRTYTVYNPANGCKITIYDPDYTAVVTDGVMSNEGTGLYFYNWETSATQQRGVYIVRITADDTSNDGVIEESLFEIK